MHDNRRKVKTKRRVEIAPYPPTPRSPGPCTHQIKSRGPITTVAHSVNNQPHCNRRLWNRTTHSELMRLRRLPRPSPNCERISLLLCLFLFTRNNRSFDSHLHDTNLVKCLARLISRQNSLQEPDQLQTGSQRIRPSGFQIPINIGPPLFVFRVAN